METIPKTDCRKIGFIRKPHGIRGELIFEFDPSLEKSVFGANRFFLEMEGLLVPFFVSKEGLQIKSANTAIVTFDWVNNKKHSLRLVGSSVYLYTDEIIDDPVEDMTFQYLNYSLTDERSKEIGVISGINDFSGNVVLTVISEGREFLIPFNPDLLLSVDKKQKKITLRLPEGLVE